MFSMHLWYESDAFFKSEHAITTEGVNVDAMFARETVLDLSRLFCNNVHDMAKYYGIEAANKTIVREITNVFQVKFFPIFKSMTLALVQFSYLFLVFLLFMNV